ncbi:MAG: type 1 glutamine amidotransferase [bacterium]|nr:type 1 glutamine amidotransferase [bacterium]
MNKPLLIIKNVSHEGPGILSELLEEHSIPYRIKNLDNHETFPSPREYSGIVVLGGPDSANDDSEKMKEEIQRITEVIHHQIPYLGICLGMQALVKAAGGKVIKSPIKEIGFRDREDDPFHVDFTLAGEQDPIFSGLREPLSVFQLHGETVQLTADMQLLGTGKWVKNQVIKVGRNAYGIQCHFELTERMFEHWIHTDPDLMAMNQDEVKHDWTEICSEYKNTGKQLFSNFLHISGLL